MADQQNFGRSLFKGLGKVISDAPQTHAAVQNQQMAALMQQINAQIQLQGFEMKQQEHQMNMVKMRGSLRKTNLEAQILEWDTAAWMSPEQKAEQKLDNDA